MRKVEKYKLVELISGNEVNEYLIDGWELYGSPLPETESNYIKQAMVKYKYRDPKLGEGWDNPNG